MTTIKVEEIPADLKAREFLESLDPSQGEVVVEQGGRARLVFYSASVLEQRRRAKDELFTLIDGLRQRNPQGDSDDVLGELEALDHPERSVP